MGDSTYGFFAHDCSSQTLLHIPHVQRAPTPFSKLCMVPLISPNVAPATSYKIKPLQNIWVNFFVYVHTSHSANGLKQKMSGLKPLFTNIQQLPDVGVPTIRNNIII
jgi:hypothetical protein